MVFAYHCLSFPLSSISLSLSDICQISLSEDNVRTSEPCESCKPWLQVMQANMRVTQLLKANHFKMGAYT